MQNFTTTRLRLGKRISLVLWLIDQYTALGSNEEDIRVYLNGRPADFQRKAGGYLVFSELEEKVYRVLIESERYFPEEFEVRLDELDQAEPVVWVSLKPSLLYRFNSTATLIRASVFQEHGEPAYEAQLTAVLCSDNCARARLGRQGASAGAKELSLVDVSGRMAPGDVFKLRPPQTEGGDICEVVSMGVGEGIYGLKHPLESDHERGELLMPVITARTEQRGETVLAFRNFRQKECDICLEISADGRRQIHNITLQSGQTHILGRIII